MWPSRVSCVARGPIFTGKLFRAAAWILLETPSLVTVFRRTDDDHQLGVEARGQEDRAEASVVTQVRGVGRRDCHGLGV